MKIHLESKVVLERLARYVETILIGHFTRIKLNVKSLKQLMKRVYKSGLRIYPSILPTSRRLHHLHLEI
jgi:hypothetical protein